MSDLTVLQVQLAMDMAKVKDRTAGAVHIGGVSTMTTCYKSKSDLTVLQVQFATVVAKVKDGTAGAVQTGGVSTMTTYYKSKSG